MGKSLRYTMAVLAAATVVWAFAYVAYGALVGANAGGVRRVTLTLLHWGTPEEDRIVQRLADRYMADHPDVRIERINTPDLPSKLKTMMAAGTPPDLFYLPTDLLPELAELKLIRPLDDDLRRTGGDTRLGDFYPILLDAFRYDVETGRLGTGPMYGLPKDFTTLVFYVNGDLFERAGVPVPYGGWTWDEYESAMRKIAALDAPPGDSAKIYGGVLQTGATELRTILWTFGGDFFGPGGFRDVALDTPAAQEALRMIARVRLDDRSVFNATGIAKDAGQEFVNGHIGCLGPIGRWMVPQYAGIKKFRWDVVPVPSKTPQSRVGQMITTGWTMASATKHPRECFDLMQFLCGRDGLAEQTRLGLSIPPLKSVANSPDFLSPPGIPAHRADVFLSAIDVLRLGQSPRQQQWQRIVSDNITESIQLGSQSTLDNARAIKTAWLRELDSPLRKRQWQRVNWGVVLPAAGAAVLAAILGLVLLARRETLGKLDRAQERTGYAFVAPWVIGFLALTLGPMLVSLLLSFTQWTGMNGIDQARSVGTANYAQLFTSDPTFYQSLKVTLYFVVLSVPIGQIAAVAVAMLMNAKVRGIAVFRTIYFVPSVVSGVALAVLWLQVFNNDYGLLNAALRPLTSVFGESPPDWFGRDARRWAIPAFVIMGLWGVGSGMVIYLAGLKGIPASLYEAATVDGAGPVRKFWNVTLPMLSPLIFYNVVMAIIGSFQVFTQAFVMTGAGPGNSTLFYVLNLYRQAFEFHNMGYASAMAWVLFVIVLALTALVFRGSRKLVYYEGQKA